MEWSGRTRPLPLSLSAISLLHHALPCLSLKTHALPLHRAPHLPHTRSYIQTYRGPGWRATRGAAARRALSHLSQVLASAPPISIDYTASTHRRSTYLGCPARQLAGRRAAGWCGAAALLCRSACNASSSRAGTRHSYRRAGVSEIWHRRGTGQKTYKYRADAARRQNNIRANKGAVRYDYHRMMPSGKSAAQPPLPLPTTVHTTPIIPTPVNDYYVGHQNTYTISYRTTCHTFTTTHTYIPFCHSGRLGGGGVTGRGRQAYILTWRLLGIAGRWWAVAGSFGCALRTSRYLDGTFSGRSYSFSP